MGISREQAETLVNQVQQSHRLLAGFYKRILPAIDNLANQFGAGFWYWRPTSFDRPCSSTTRPSSKWAWDFLPLVTATLVYVRNDEGYIRKSDLVMHFQLCNDPAVLPELRTQKGQPDPTTIPVIEPFLRVYLYRPIEDSDADLYHEWEKVSPPEGAAGIITDIAYNFQAMWLEIPLADFVHAPLGFEEQIASFSQRVKPTA